MAEALIEISKHISDLNSTDAVLYEPRSWSPEALREACNNLKINVDATDIGPMELISIEFLLKNFFYLQHQTGLYNPQKKLWTHLAQVRKVKIKEYKRISKQDREHTKISDLILEDINGKFIKARLVHPGSKAELPGFNNLIGGVPRGCLGIFYISEFDPNEKTLGRIKEKTNAIDFIDKYRSPIAKNCSLNLIKYSLKDDKILFKLIYPDLGKDIEAELCFGHS